MTICLGDDDHFWISFGTRQGGIDGRKQCSVALPLLVEVRERKLCEGGQLCEGRCHDLCV